MRGNANAFGRRIQNGNKRAVLMKCTDDHGLKVNLSEEVEKLENFSSWARVFSLLRVVLMLDRATISSEIKVLRFEHELVA